MSAQPEEFKSKGKKGFIWPVDEPSKATIDYRYALFYVFFFFCLFIIAAFGLIAES